MELTKEQIDKNREQLPKHIIAERRDIANPDRRQDVTVINSVNDDEDENTVAKSIVDEIIEETEA